MSELIGKLENILDISESKKIMSSPEFTTSQLNEAQIRKLEKEKDILEDEFRNFKKNYKYCDVTYTDKYDKLKSEYEAQIRELEKEKDSLFIKLSNFNESHKYCDVTDTNKNDKLISEIKKLWEVNEQLQDIIKNTPKDNCNEEKAEIKKLREEINQLKKSSSSQNNSNNSNNSNPPTNNIIMVNKPPIVYENDDRFSDYIFRNPRAEKNTYVKENVGEFLNKLFNSDEK